MAIRITVCVVAGLHASAAVAGTDFGVRTVGNAQSFDVPAAQPAVTFSLTSAATVGQRFGVVTSMRRSAEHNRRVGGVRNSFHISGRAIDIARRPGVRHYQIEQALRLAGFSIIESLDEGDHSHFAFAAGRAIPKPSGLKPVEIASATPWRVVLAPR